MSLHVKRPSVLPDAKWQKQKQRNRALKTRQVKTSWENPQHPPTTAHLQGRRTEPPEFFALNLMAPARQTFGECFKSSNYLSSAKCSKSHLETSCTKLRYSSGQK